MTKNREQVELKLAKDAAEKERGHSDSTDIKHVTDDLATFGLI